MQVNIKNLIDDVQCCQIVRELRWPDGIACPSCESTQVIKRGFDDTEPSCQRYECTDCHTRFDDLTDTIFAGHHQPQVVQTKGRKGRRRLQGQGGRGTLDKERPPSFGMMQQGGQVVITLLANVQQKTIAPLITDTIVPGTRVYG